MTERRLEESKVMHCPKCNEVISIVDCKWVNGMTVAYKSLKEINSKLQKDFNNLRLMKNGVIQALHGQIKKLINLMTEEQKEKVKEMTQEMRETIKRWEKQKE